MSAAAVSIAQKAAAPRGGYTPLDHTFFHLAGKVSGEAQMWCILYVLRKTRGVERARNTPAPEWSEEPITNKQFAKIAKTTERAIETVIPDAVERGLLERKEVGRGFIYRACVDKWKSAPPYEPKEAPRKPAQEEVQNHNPEDDDSKESETTNTRSGLRYKVEALHIVPQTGAKRVTLSEPVELKTYQYENTSQSAEAMVEYNAGVLHIKVMDSDDTRSAVRVLRDMPIEKNGLGLTPLHELLDRKFGEEGLVKQAGSAPHPDMVKEIQRLLVAGRVSLDQFEGAINHYGQKGRIKSPEFLKYIAKECARPETRAAWSRAHPTKQRKSPGNQMSEEDVRGTLMSLYDPSLSDEAREYHRAGLSMADPDLVARIRREFER